MNTADEYRLVTGGFSDTTTRRTRARVWTPTANRPRAAAALLNGRPHPSQDRAARTITPTYIHWHKKNGSNRFRKYSSPVFPAGVPSSGATYFWWYARTAALKSSGRSPAYAFRISWKAAAWGANSLRCSS